MPGTNGPPNFTKAQFSYPVRPLSKMRQSVIKRLGFAAMLASPPPGLNILVDDFIQEAYEELYFRYPMLRTLKWWNITTVAGERFYDIPYDGAYSGEQTDIALISGSPGSLTRLSGSWVDDGYVTGMKTRIQGSALDDGIHTVGASVAALTMDLSNATTIIGETAGNAITVSQFEFVNMEKRKLEEAWVKDDSTWTRLNDRIRPELFNETSSYIPQFFEIREFIEIWPAPDKVYDLRFKAHMGMTPLEVDTDKPAIDSRPLFLLALADAKAHYGQPDARTYYSKLEVHIGKLNAGTFGTERFIPRVERVATALPYPKVTFSRP